MVTSLTPVIVSGELVYEVINVQSLYNPRKISCAMKLLEKLSWALSGALSKQLSSLWSTVKQVAGVLRICLFE